MFAVMDTISMGLYAPNAATFVRRVILVRATAPAVAWESTWLHRQALVEYAKQDSTSVQILNASRATLIVWDVQVVLQTAQTV